MSRDVREIRVGLALVLLGLLFGVAMGISFGVNEDAYKNYIAEGIAAHPEVHDAKSQEKIWRYSQRAHFHATGIAAFALAMLFLVMFSDMKVTYKKYTSLLIGLSSLYSFSWFTMFFLAPSMGRGPAHEHALTELFAMTGVGGLMLGGGLLCANLFLGFFKASADA